MNGTIVELQKKVQEQCIKIENKNEDESRKLEVKCKEAKTKKRKEQ
jgi:hypothetical protein